MVDRKGTAPRSSSFGRGPLSLHATPSSDARSPVGPRIDGDNSLVPGLSLDRIGQALASFYDDLVAEGVPEHLAALVRQVKPTEAAVAVDAASAATPPCKTGRLALIVEDEAATRILAESLFEATELEAVGCDSAEAALDILRARGTDVALVFADIALAGAMDGLQLANAVSTLWPRARMIVTSGQTRQKPAGLPPQVVYIPKPWRPAAVLVEAELAANETPPIMP